MNATLIFDLIVSQISKRKTLTHNVFTITKKIFNFREFFLRLWPAKSSILKALLFRIFLFKTFFCSGNKLILQREFFGVINNRMAAEDSKEEGNKSNLFQII
jgi:hypothetical protein